MTRELMKGRTCPALSLPARLEIGDRAGIAVGTALHADESEAAVAIGRGRCVGFVVIARG